MPAYALVLIAAAVAVAVVAFMRIHASRRARERVDAARAAAAASVRGAELEATAARRAAETAIREELLAMRAAADEEVHDKAEDLARWEERLAGFQSEIDEENQIFERRKQELDDRDRAARSRRDRASGLRKDSANRRQEARAELERIADDTADEVVGRLRQGWVEEARRRASLMVRRIEHNSSDPSFDADARRVMSIAVSRYQNHFLTERNISTLRVGGEVCEVLQSDGGKVHEVLQRVANVQLHINEESETVRLDGLDGVGREVARRALNRLGRRASEADKASADPDVWAGKIRDNLEREIVSLGKKACTVLKVRKPHGDIIKLVGALNYRTSYTQNQWLHAVEASFLAGMMASEMGLDVKLARRATLMHDIGKALTHKIDGSHAVIGADIARTLGEDEIIANAIGAHHADEPPNSVYAYLVAAADAMSGARPGARREATDGFTHRVDDLERIGAGHRGVDRAHAVHGGRELRIYVDEAQLDDMGVVELTGQIADQIAEEMTFPGQIKVTVIRAFEAVSVAN